MRHHSSEARRCDSRRAFDIVCASVALVLLAPFFVAISIAVRLEGGSPIFFVQERLTRNGRIFRMYKFRKFWPEESSSGCPLTLNHDMRLTKVGKFLCSTKLDELPQFWNVLIGDMSVVGPRPESLVLSDCFQGGYEELLNHTPGLMGPAQVNFRNESELYPPGADPVEFYRGVLFPLKAAIDLEYYRRRTCVGDIGWIILGMAAMIGLRLPMIDAKRYMQNPEGGIARELP